MPDPIGRGANPGAFDIFNIFVSIGPAVKQHFVERNAIRIYASQNTIIAKIIMQVQVTKIEQITKTNFHITSFQTKNM
jgi:hypothetical protein